MHVRRYVGKYVHTYVCTYIYIHIHIDSHSYTYTYGATSRVVQDLLPPSRRQSCISLAHWATILWGPQQLPVFWHSGLILPTWPLYRSS